MSILTRHKGITYSGGQSATLPILLHSAGVSGANHRWVAASAASTGTIAALPDQIGTLVLSGQAAIADALYGRTIRFNGTSHLLNTSFSDVQTISVVCRVQAANGTMQGIFNAAAAKVSRTALSTDEAPRIYASIAGGDNLTLAAQTNGTNYHVVSVSRSTTDTIFSCDSTSSSTTAGSATLNRLDLGASEASSNFGQIDVLEVITWPNALTAQQHQQVYGALQLHYGAAIA